MKVVLKENPSEVREVYALSGRAKLFESRICYLLDDGFFYWHDARDCELIDNTLPDHWVYYRNEKRTIEVEDPIETNIAFSFDWYLGPEILVNPAENIVHLSNLSGDAQKVFRKYTDDKARELSRTVNIKDIINEWDPIGLLPYCPEDEYQLEISDITYFLKQTKDENELGEYICSVFTKAFGNDTFQRPVSECRLIAKMILKTIK